MNSEFLLQDLRRFALIWVGTGVVVEYRMAGRPRAISRAIGRAVFALVAMLPCTLSAPSAQASFHRHHYWQPVAEWTDPQKDAALVVDGQTGRVLYSRSPDAPRHPASLTKMMTLYLLFEQLKSGQMTLATPISISDHAAVQAPTKLYARPGTTVPVDTAIKALVVLSANDIAVAVAEAVGGTESHFAELMTAKARALGMFHTYYHNASGLPDELQITTASDLALLARHLAYDFPEYFHYFSTPSFSYRGITHLTHDNLIGRYDGADGIKTGYTNASGFNLVSSVVRDGAHVIGVVMGGVTARRRDAEMMQLLDSTFAAINQNPTVVAHGDVPWQAMASNAQTAPIIAGFQLGGSQQPPSPPTNQAAAEMSEHSIVSGGADDEDAAESRPDPELDAAARALSADTNDASAAPAASQAVPARVALATLPIPPSPLPNRVALATPAPPQAVPAPASPAPAAAFRANVIAPIPAGFRPRVMPRPRPRAVLLASYHPQTTAITPKPRATILDEKGPAEPSNVSAQSARERQWAIQIGAFADSSMAKAHLASYAERSMDVLGQATREVIPFQSVDGHTLYRARFGPFPEREAREVCQRLTERGQTCFAALTLP
jgi:D-alanyl-D-alanine carboxypeptidase